MVDTRFAAHVSGKALAAGPLALPAANALPLTNRRPDVPIVDEDKLSRLNSQERLTRFREVSVRR